MDDRRNLSRGFYYELEVCLTADRVWVELSYRSPLHGRVVWDSWGMLRPSGPVTELWVHHVMWSALMEASERSEQRS
jgi:hypothetical protein